MTMLMLQGALWVLAAFLLGYVIGHFLKSLFCREEDDRDVRGINQLVMHHKHGDSSPMAAPVAAASVSAAPVFGDIDPHKPILINPHQPIVIDPYKPIVDPPDKLLYAGNSGQFATEKSETNWLHLLVQQVKNTYQGLNPHAISRLWQGDKGYDCSALQQYKSLTLQPGQSGTLGLIQCAVPHAGFVTVAEDASNISEKTAILFSYSEIVVCHDADGRYHYIQVTE